MAQEVGVMSLMERCPESPVTHRREEAEKHQQNGEAEHELVTEVMQNSRVVRERI